MIRIALLVALIGCSDAPAPEPDAPAASPSVGRREAPGVEPARPGGGEVTAPSGDAVGDTVGDARPEARNEAAGGAAIQLRGQTVAVIEGLSAAALTENSLWIGNFRR